MQMLDRVGLAAEAANRRVGRYSRGMLQRLALGWGIGLTLGALLFRAQGTPAVVIALSIASFTYGGLLGGFLLGILSARARQRDEEHGHTTGQRWAAACFSRGGQHVKPPATSQARGRRPDGRIRRR